MSQSAMGQAPRQTIGDFLHNMGDNYSLPQGEGTLYVITSPFNITLEIRIVYHKEMVRYM